GGRDVRERGHAVAADGAVRGREHDVQSAPFIFVLGQREHGRDGLTVVQRQKVYHWPTLGVRATFRQAPYLHPIDATEVGEEQYRVVGRSDEQGRYRVLVLRLHSGAALAAALLFPEQGQWSALDVAGHGHGHDHVLALDEVLVLDAFGSGCQLAHARRRELGFDL